MQPLISIIVPCYNVEAYLPKCVNSILEQTYKKIEIILVDDGSTDNSGKICDEYAQRDSRIVVIHKTNGGQGEARNIAIECAKGEWISFADGDDLLSPDYIEVLYDLVHRNNCMVGIASYRTFLEGDSPSSHQPFYKKELVLDKMKGVEALFYQKLFDTAPWGKIFHKKLFSTDVRFPVGFVYEDLATIYLLILKADKIAFCNRKIYNYLLRSNSTEGQSFNIKKLNSAIRVFEMIESHANELKIVEKSVRCRLLSFCFHILLEMPPSYPDKRKYILMDYIKANRWKVLIDHKARKKARLAAALSYFGLGLQRKILGIIKERN